VTIDAILNVFQGVQTFAASPLSSVLARILLIFLGLLLMYLGKKGVLEPLLMIPMGLGMATINASVLFFDPLSLHGGLGTLFVEAQAGAGVDKIKNAGDLMYIMGIDWLQPIYTFTFSNGLIACFVFMGIGALLDVGFIMSRPFLSMFLAI
jgi:oxaloacetate decarboxylase beta subunit